MPVTVNLFLVGNVFLVAVAAYDLAPSKLVHCAYSGNQHIPATYISRAHMVSGSRLHTCEKKRTERGTIMLKHTLRWILPLVVIAVVALFIILSPVVATHAAAPAIHHITSHGMNPNFYWRP